MELIPVRMRRIGRIEPRPGKGFTGHRAHLQRHADLSKILLAGGLMRLRGVSYESPSTEARENTGNGKNLDCCEARASRSSTEHCHHLGSRSSCYEL